MNLKLRDWPTRPKTVVAFLLMFLFFSETLALVHYGTRIGHGNEAAYFAGNESEDLADEVPLFYPKSLQELLDVAHPHSFGFTMYFAMIGFLWATIDIKKFWWMAWLTGFSGCLIGFIVAPFFIRYVAPGAHGMFAAFGAGLTLHLYLFIFCAIRELRASGP